MSSSFRYLACGFRFSLEYFVCSGGAFLIPIANLFVFGFFLGFGVFSSFWLFLFYLSVSDCQERLVFKTPLQHYDGIVSISALTLITVKFLCNSKSYQVGITVAV